MSLDEDDIKALLTLLYWKVGEIEGYLDGAKHHPEYTNSTARKERVVKVETELASYKKAMEKLKGGKR